MASLTFNPLPPPTTPPLAAGAVPAVAAVAPAATAANFAAELAELPLPAAQTVAPAGAKAPAVAGDTVDGAAMRPDQVAMARQLSFQRADAATLGGSWRAMVRDYGRQLMVREQQALARQLPATALLAAQHGPLPQQVEPSRAPPFDAWRFTVHAGSAQAQHLSVVTEERDEPPGRRRRGRAALRLELELPDGTCVMLQVEPVPGGIAMELCAPGRDKVDQLRALQPALERAVRRVGLEVQRWTFRDYLPAASVHASVELWQAESVLTLPVFRAVAELALLVPHATGSGDAPGTQDSADAGHTMAGLPTS